MLACHTWLAADYLLRVGFTIDDPGEGKPRTAVRDALSYEIEPACTCADCPRLSHASQEVNE